MECLDKDSFVVVSHSQKRWIIYDLCDKIIMTQTGLGVIRDLKHIVHKARNLFQNML